MHLTHCGLVIQYGYIYLGQAITWTNVDWSSVKSSDINITTWAIPQEMPQPSITKMHLKIIDLKFHGNLPGANKLSR